MSFAFLFLLPIITASLASFNVSFALKNENEYIEPTALTKRVWISETDHNFTPEGTQLNILLKDSILSKPSEPILLDKITTLSGGLYYYTDIPISYEGFKIVSIDELNNNIVNETRWVYDIRPSFVYEIRMAIKGHLDCRNSDLGYEKVADSFLLSAILSSYCSFLSNYENGYSAYEELEVNWLKFQREEVQGYTNENVFLKDYSEEQVINKRFTEEKARTISVKEKIEELKKAYEEKPRSSPLSKNTNIKMALIALSVSIVLTALLIFGLNAKKLIKRI